MKRNGRRRARRARLALVALLLGAAATACRRDDERGGAGGATSDEGRPLATSWQGLLEDGAGERLQRRLAARGYYDGPADGQLGPRTEAALRELQRSEDLPVTGVPDRETVRRLDLDVDDIYERSRRRERERDPSERESERTRRRDRADTPRDN